jgi:hypothetical protein
LYFRGGSPEMGPMRQPQTISVQYSVSSKIRQFEEDLVWGPTLFVTGLAALMTMLHEFANPRSFERPNRKKTPWRGLSN